MGESGGKKPVSREERIKAALRENLKRRKQKARAVAAHPAPNESTQDDENDGKAETVCDQPT